MLVTSHSPEETIEAGRQFARQLHPGDFVLLIGNLGAGKTTFAKGVIQELTLRGPDDVVSPTYSLVHEYTSLRPHQPPVIHADLYRLDEPAEVLALGWDDYFDGHSILLVEWGERFPEILPPDRWEVRFSPGPADLTLEASRRTEHQPRTSRV
jgi:tRNA threonylcarbamoyladenosine biosynthesis protein TsaE